MYQKFIITNDGVLKFGTVHLHRDLIPQGDDGCHGGGFWQVDEQRGMIILHGRSYDYGPPDFKFATSIDRNTISDLPTYPVFYRSGVEGHEKYEPIGRFNSSVFFKLNALNATKSIIICEIMSTFVA